MAESSTRNSIGKHTFQDADAGQLMESVLSLVAYDIRSAARVDLQTAIQLAILDDRDAAVLERLPSEFAMNIVRNLMQDNGRGPMERATTDNERILCRELQRMSQEQLPSRDSEAKSWLIEFHAGATLWFAGTFRQEGRRRLADFVTDANAAVRYPSRAAAEWAFEAMQEMRPHSILGADCYRITEHEWIEPVSERGSSEADAVIFASELFALINYRRAHSLSRDVWHEADETDEAGQRCIAFLRSRNLIENDSRNSTWWRFIDPAKRAKPPSFDTIERVKERQAERPDS